MNFFSIIKLTKLLIKILNGKERNKNETNEKHNIYILHNSSSWDDMMYHGLDHGITKLKTLLYSKKLKKVF